MTVVDRALAAQNGIRPLDARFAETMSRLAGEDRPLVLFYAAYASLRLSQGHVCVDMRQQPGGLDLTGYLEFPRASRLIEALRSSALVSDGSSLTPLVLDGKDRLYLRRYWMHEQFLAGELTRRAAEPDPVADSAFLEATLRRLFGETAKGQPDLQRAGAKMAAERRFTVISGGPGTGKTTTVVKVLALLVEAAQHSGRPPPRIALMAPTGKAAARLGEAIKRAKPGLACAEEIKLAIPDGGTTIHRALGPIRGSSTRFRHHAGHPLAADIVLVDEASMVPIALMARLIEAIPPQARLILLGDKDQLAAVEAGNVLGDICNDGGSLGQPTSATSATGIWDCVTHLEVSHRYQQDSGIAALAQAIITGDADAAVALFASGRHDDLVRLDPEADGHMHPRLRDQVRTEYAHYLEPEAAPAERLRALDRFRILCAHRVGPHGAVDYNLQARGELSRAGLLHGSAEHYAGRPIMLAVNSYPLKLYNGDIGIELYDPDSASLRVFVGTSDGAIKKLSPARLPAHDTVFAMTVHKSQGSEFDHVAVIVPDRASPIVTRELLYTAVTRAKQSVTLYASEQAIREAVRRRVDRASGLRDALWG